MNQTDMLHKVFSHLFASHGADAQVVALEWQWLASEYQQKKRHYHSLEHLAHMYQQLQTVRHLLEDETTLLCSLFYHDLVYEPLSKQNEQHSADRAAESLLKFNFQSAIIEKCQQQILATSNHEASSNNDTNYFLDADLSILGSPWPEYQDYADKIRKEYKVIPSIVYRPGRKKVLQHFLAMESIFKTEPFKQKFEQQARENLHKEIAMLVS